MHEAHIIQAVEVHTGGGNGAPGLGPVNAFTTENVKRHLLSTELNTRRTDKGFGVSSKEGLTL
jgi:hypothetical protein